METSYDGYLPQVLQNHAQMQRKPRGRAMKPLWWITAVISDQSLSSDERALLIWFGTRAAKWEYHVPEVTAGMGWGRQKYQRTLASLKAAGRLKTEHIHDRFGRIVETKLSLLTDNNRRAENQASGKGNRRADCKASGPRAENQASRRKTLLKAESRATFADVTHPQFSERGGRDV